MRATRRRSGAAARRYGRGHRPARRPPRSPGNGSGGVASSTTSTASTPSSSASRRARPRRWTRSSGWCWSWAGRRWRTPASCPPRCAAAAPGCSSARSGDDYADPAAPAADPTPSTAHTVTGLHRGIIANRRLVHARAARPEPHRRHRPVLVAGRRAPGLREPAPRRVRDSRSPAACNLNLAPESTVGADQLRRRCPRTAAATPSTPAPTATSAARAAAWSCSSRCRGALADGDRVLLRHPRQRGQQRRRRRRPDRARARRRRRRCCGWPTSGPGSHPAQVAVRRAARHRHPTWATRSRPPRSAPCSAPDRAAADRCWSARSRPTSATWRARRASSACSRRCSASGTGQLPASLQLRAPRTRASRWTSCACGCRPSRPVARTPDRPLVAGVSSFGMGGTNCHLVLTEAPGPPRRPRPRPPTGAVAAWLRVRRVPPQALRAQAARLASASTAPTPAGRRRPVAWPPPGRPSPTGRWWSPADRDELRAG